MGSLNGFLEHMDWFQLFLLLIGAVACLFEEGRASVAAIAQTCAYHELSTSKTFNELYIDNMGFEE